MAQNSQASCSDPQSHTTTLDWRRGNRRQKEEASPLKISHRAPADCAQFLYHAPATLSTTDALPLLLKVAAWPQTFGQQGWESDQPPWKALSSDFPLLVNSLSDRD